MRTLGSESDAGWICAYNLDPGSSPYGLRGRGIRVGPWAFSRPPGPMATFTVHTVLGFSGGVSQGGSVTWEIEPGDREPDVDDFLYALNLRGSDLRLVDVVGPTFGGSENRIQELYERLVPGGQYTILRRRCPRCMFCNQCCTRTRDPHLSCAHIDRPDALAHVWYLTRRTGIPGLVHGHLNLVGLDRTEEAFGIGLVLEDLRAIRMERLQQEFFDAPGDVARIEEVD